MFWSDHNVESLLLGKYFRRSENTYGVKTDQNVESVFSQIVGFRHCDITYGIKTDQNVENQKEQLLMVYCLCVPRPVGG